MREFKKRTSRKGELIMFGVHTVGLLVLFCITLVAVRAAWGMYVKLDKATTGQEVAEAQLAALKAQQAEVAASVKDLSSKRGVEAQIRQRFGVAKEGEGEIEIVRDTAVPTTSPKESEWWWQGVLRALFMW